MDSYGKLHVGFVFGKSKIAPKHDHTIPNPDLCASVFVWGNVEMVSQYLRILLESRQYHMDRSVVL